MNSMLSVNFADQRTFVSVLEPVEKGMVLKYINSTENPVDLESPDSVMEQQGAKELQQLLEEVGDDISRISVTLDSEAFLMAQIPGNEEMKPSELNELVQLEIRNAFPQFKSEDFVSTVIPMAAKKDGTQMMLTLIFSKKLLKSCKELLAVLDKPIHVIDVSQLTTHSAFLYNYPEQADKNIAILGIQDQFVDVSVIRNGQPLYYNLAPLKDKELIGDLCIEEFDKIQADFVDTIDAAYFFGSGLNIDMLVNAQSMIMGMGMEMQTGRLNAFRMIQGLEDTRTKDYCIRSAHIFPPCIGGNIPSYHKLIKLY